jgi:hypothetical protein
METDAVNPTARSGVPAAPAGEVPARTWFEAPGGSGLLRLSVPGTARHAADAAVALYRCSELLDALEQWSMTALAWRWITPPMRTTLRSHVVATWQTSDPSAAAEPVPEAAWRLELPWTMVRALPAPTGALAQRMRWSEVPVVLAAAQMHLTADELQHLEPGGAVILPESVRPPWRGLLRAFDEPAHPGCGMPVALHPTLAAERIAGRSGEALHPAEGGGAWCEVRFDRPRTLCGDRLAAWYQGDLGQPGTGASLWCCASEFEAARPLASGQLMPWGDGWALALEAICEPRRVAPGVHDGAEAESQGRA